MKSTFQLELIPTWARVAAWAVPLTVLPSATWRLIMAVDAYLSGENPCVPPTVSLAERIYVPALTFVELGFALLTVGLISRWGEVVPRWVPFIGARRIPTTAVVIAAVAGAVLTAFANWGMTATYLLGAEPLNPLPPGCAHPGWNVAILYLPTVLWPPLLLAVTWHYLRRRRGSANVRTTAP